MDSVRIDKWLWAARFFKTRSMAKHAIEGGKIKIAGVRPKPSREVKVGETLVIKQGFDEKTVTILALTDVRRGAPEAQQLYQESHTSIQRREEAAAVRKANKAAFLGAPEQRPSKKQRRQIHRFKNINSDFCDLDKE